MSISTQAQLDAAVLQEGDVTTGRLERLFSRLFLGLVYPQIWEDPVVDMKALAIAPGDNLICIASGSCNLMSYLTAGPASVTAVDLSPAHVALGRLKLTAARALPDYAAFYQFFARADMASNMALYDRYLRPELDAASRTYWDTRQPFRRRISLFRRGFYRHGLLGRFLGVVHLIARLGRVDFSPLLIARTTEEQTAFFDTKIAPLFDMWLVRRLSGFRAALFGLGIPPAQYDKLAADGDGDVLPVLRERVRKLMCDFPIRDNYFAWQAFARGYDPAPDGALPPYLQPDAYAALRDNADRGRIVNRSLTDHLGDQPDSCTHGYVLLDAQDWMNDTQLNALWREITRTAAPGARVIFRTGGTADILPGRVAPRILDRWSYDSEASAEGTAQDRSAIYGAFHLYRFQG
ncbi:MAG: S-adenosylmethionine--diacylglycerol 3-amino-3-carboxypropyl transferase [Alphaproteobacteria bacterium MedPE-SWcel]|nr:MAG: S-adenosylmethionine--diacylglycerol 3-amino-3-carboxypropyl transferase [Alphaproteobacteria bacterium MedPE-SWcel]